MLNFYQLRTRIKDYKNRQLKPFVEFLKQKLNLSSNFLSSLNLICGVTAAFFLFEDAKIYAIFILIAISFDVLDGALAKVEGKRDEGWIVDVGFDRLVMLGILTKMAISQSFTLIYAIISLYIFVNFLLIYERVLLKKKVDMVHVDVYVWLIFIFSYFKFGLFLLVISLCINFVIMLLQMSLRYHENFKNESTLANLISALRPVLAAYVLFTFKSNPLFLAGWIIFIIFLDAVDGFVARKMIKKSKFGALVDIIADRAVELIILFTYAHWGLIPYIFPIIFLVRGLLTDFLRILNNKYKDEEFPEPLSIGKADNRWMRGIYAFVKLAAFSTILISYQIGYILMILALIINLIRGLPVIFSTRSKFLFKKIFQSLS